MSSHTDLLHLLFFFSPFLAFSISPFYLFLPVLHNWSARPRLSNGEKSEESDASIRGPDCMMGRRLRQSLSHLTKAKAFSSKLVFLVILYDSIGRVCSTRLSWPSPKAPSELVGYMEWDEQNKLEPLHAFLFSLSQKHRLQELLKAQQLIGECLENCHSQLQYSIINCQKKSYNGKTLKVIQVNEILPTVDLWMIKNVI